MEAKYSQLVNWIVQHGGEVSDSFKLDLLHEGNRTIRATRSIPANTVLAKVPRKLVMTGETSELALSMLRALQSEEELFWPYVSFLPTEEEMSSFPQFELTFKQQLKAQQVCPSFHNALMCIHNSVNVLYYDHADSILEGWRRPEVFKRLLTLIKSRAWGKIGMIPLLDLFNHSYDSNCQVEPSADDDFCFIKTLKDVSEGEELTHIYNRNNPIEFYLTYGIRQLFNVNYLQVAFSYSPNTKEDEHKIGVLLQRGFSGTKLEIQLDDKPESQTISPNSKVFEFLRIVNLSNEQLNKSDPSKFVSLENEHQVLKFFKRVVKTKLHHIPEQFDEALNPLVELMRYENKIANKYIEMINQYWVSLLE